MTHPKTAYGKVPSEVIWSGALHGMTCSEALAYLAIVSHVNGTQWVASPSMKRIADLAGISERNARRAVRKLEERGLVKIEVRRGKGRTNRYVVIGQTAKIGHSDVLLSSAKTGHPGVPLSGQNRTSGTPKSDTQVSDEQQEQQEYIYTLSPRNAQKGYIKNEPGLEDSFDFDREYPPYDPNRKIE